MTLPSPGAVTIRGSFDPSPAFDLCNLRGMRPDDLSSSVEKPISTKLCPNEEGESEDKACPSSAQHRITGLPICRDWANMVLVNAYTRAVSRKRASKCETPHTLGGQRGPPAVQQTPMRERHGRT